MSGTRIASNINSKTTFLEKSYCSVFDVIWKLHWTDETKWNLLQSLASSKFGHCNWRIEKKFIYRRKNQKVNVLLLCFVNKKNQWNLDGKFFHKLKDTAE